MTPLRRDATPRGAAIMILVAATVLGAGCGGSSGPASSQPAPAGTASVLSASSTAAPTTSPSGSLPAEAPAVQGGKYYAVFLAVAADVHDDALMRAQLRAKDLGYEGGVANIGCTPGAREQLRLKPGTDYTAFSILFATRQQAQRLVAAYGAKVVGIAYVTAGCLD